MNTMKPNHTLLLRSVLRAIVPGGAIPLALGAAASASAQVAIIDTHVDIGLEGPAAGPDWGLHVHDEENDAEYAPHEAYFFVDPAHAALPQPADAQWSFIGQTPGQTIYVLPQGQNPNLPFLGFAAAEVPSETFDQTFNNDSRVNAAGRWVGFTVTAVSGPGEFSIWQTGGFGAPIVWVSTFDGGLDATDTVHIQQGGHAHFNWGFTEAGTYSITVVASGYIGGELLTSEAATFTFSTVAIPEPSAFSALAGVGALGFAATRRRAARHEGAR